jgi:NTE family protein
MKKKRPTIGLALSGGFAKGLAHVGVLKVFEENDIPIDYISGTSMGSMIGGLYCSGLSPEQIEDIILTTEWHGLFNFTMPKNYLIRKFAIRKLIKRLVKDKSFSQLKPKLFVSGTRLKDGQKIVFNSGNLTKAIMASVSLPGILKPEKVNGTEIVDGGLVDPLPVASLKEKCDKIIAVDISVTYKEQLLRTSHVTDRSRLVKELKEDFVRMQLKNLKDFFKHQKFKKIPLLFRTILVKTLEYVFTPAAVLDLMAGRTPPEIAETILQSYTIVMGRVSDLTLKAYNADIVIQPTSKYTGWFEFDKAEEFIKGGEKAAKNQLAAIKKLL